MFFKKTYGLLFLQINLLAITLTIIYSLIMFILFDSYIYIFYPILPSIGLIYWKKQIKKIKEKLNKN
jgi:hypothetical protein